MSENYKTLVFLFIQIILMDSWCVCITKIKSVHTNSVPVFQRMVHG